MDPELPTAPLPSKSAALAGVDADTTSTSPPPLDIFKDVPNETLSGLSEPTTAPELHPKAATIAKNINVVVAVSEDEPAIAPKPVLPPKIPLGKPPVPAVPTATPTPTPVSIVPNVVTASPAVSPPEAVSVASLARKDAYTDSVTDSAVADVLAHEGDDLLAAEDAVRSIAMPARPLIKATEPTSFQKLLRKRTIFIVLAILILALAVLPKSRYLIAGLVVKKTLVVSVIDSKTAQPVSGAIVAFHGREATTDGSGKVSLRVPLGTATLAVGKQYYQSYTSSDTVGFAEAKPEQVRFVATGRTVPITITNRLTGKPLAGVRITALGTSAQTNKTGQASIVLPADKTAASATVAAGGYNTTSYSLQITDTDIAANHVRLVPAGSIFFLSQDDGKLDVVKTKLDGSNPTTVIAGSGQEDPANTVLQASSDGKFAVLKSRRDGTNTGLYLISASNNKVTQFESSDASYSLIGWVNDNFLYDAVHPGTPTSQSGHETIKSYDANGLQLNQLDADQVAGGSPSYAFQEFANFYLVGGQLTYTKQWQTGGSSGSTYDISTKTDSISATTPDGRQKRDYQTFAAVNVSYIQAVQYQPSAIYYGVYTAADSKTTYYNLQQSSVNEVDGSQAASSFNQMHPTYYASPDQSKSYWSAVQNGQQSLLTAGLSATAPDAIMGGSGLQAHGWLGSNYLLAVDAHKNYYILPATGGTALALGQYL